MGEVSTDNLLAAIGRARTRPLSRVFCALGVRGTGRSMSRRIARHFGTMEAVRAADAEGLQEVDGIGPEKAPVIVADLAELSDLIDKLVPSRTCCRRPCSSAGAPGARAGIIVRLSHAGAAVPLTGPFARGMRPSHLVTAGGAARPARG
ncbi:helix-hairpin-helix domain-containing protein [Microbispora triticiradicis]|uniref:helix-hairpin-helix domain-containing protein n=1 Tax=Microbispora triticiradicis TaxID=2200763 RepID=UPI001AD83292|nr:helix-hairpin-helix domain-containing protein [Microbispora triticiradicis]